MSNILEISNLTINFATRDGSFKAVDNISFNIESNKTMALVGESGSGKSVTAMSILQLLPRPQASYSQASSIKFKGDEIIDAPNNKLLNVRGNIVSMVFQEPMTSLNPYHRVGDQITESILLHTDSTKKEAIDEAKKLLELVEIDDIERRFYAYPHELSGGQRQRIMIAMALVNKPQLLIADEPTTALDVTIQSQILKLIKKLQENRDVAVIFISHDLGVVAGIADHVMVMCEGVIKEKDKTDEIFYRSKDEYTKKLLAAIPEGAKKRPNRSNENALIEVTNLKTFFKDHKKKKTDQNYFTKAVNDVSLEVFEGEILGLVGESGSGKSTLGRSMLRLAPIFSGSVKYLGNELGCLTNRELLPYRRKMQMIFQDPYASLNPRMTVYETLSEPLLYHEIVPKSRVLEFVNQLMSDVGLAKSSIYKYPHEFSGGQRQRIAIGRAIATKPEFIIADEPVSALDVTIQSQILDLILELVERHNLTMLFISHDLSVVRYISDRIIVMNNGVIVENGNTESVWDSPKHKYTQDLLSAIPLPDPIKERQRAI